MKQILSFIAGVGLCLIILLLSVVSCSNHDSSLPAGITKMELNSDSTITIGFKHLTAKGNFPFTISGSGVVAHFPKGTIIESDGTITIPFGGYTEVWGLLPGEDGILGEYRCPDNCSFKASD